jgi:hypothetical protein
VKSCSLTPLLLHTLVPCFVTARVIHAVADLFTRLHRSLTSPHPTLLSLALCLQDELLPSAVKSAGAIADVCVTFSQAAVALTKSGDVIAWSSKLDAAKPAAATVPSKLRSGSVDAISCGFDHVVVRLKDGSAAAFGDKTSVPAAAKAAESVKEVAAGYSHSVFLLAASSGKVVQDGKFA